MSKFSQVLKDDDFFMNYVPNKLYSSHALLLIANMILL